MNDTKAAARGAAEITDWLVDEVARLLAVPRDAIHPDSPVSMYLTDSRDALSLAADLQDWLGVPVSASALWDHPTLAALSRHLADSLIDAGAR